MTQLTSSQDFKVATLGHRSAPTCLSLAERTFGKESSKYKIVQNFMKEKRAGLVASIRGCVVGFIVYDNRNREKAEVLAFAVHKPDRRQGIGRLLMGKVAKWPRTEVSVKVDERNLAAQIFLRVQGFRATEIEHGSPEYYVFERGTVGIASAASEVNTEPQTVGAKQ